MKISYAILIFNDIKIHSSDIPKIRGYLSNRLIEYQELHNHIGDSQFDYRFPSIQFRIINDRPAIIACKRSYDVIKDIFFSIDKLEMGIKKLEINEKKIEIRESDFGDTNRFFDYKFISPWMALNNNNHVHYKKLDSYKKQQLLKKILRGNLLTISKGFNYTINNFDNIKVEGHFIPKYVNFKSQKMLCFNGSFTVNFRIPDYLALGKQSSRGFGVVREIRSGGNYD